MTCTDVETVLPEFLDSVPGSADHNDFELHLKSCAACSDLVSDLRLIASEANQLAATDEPAPRVWLGIAAQLRAEGLIRESGPTLVKSLPLRRWTSTAWWLAPVAAGLLAAGAYVVSHQPSPQVADSESKSKIDSAVPANVAVAPTAAENTAETPVKIVAKKSPASISSNPAPIEPAAHDSAEPTEIAASAPSPTQEASEASAEDQQFLSVVSTRAPSMRATYENQLQAVNSNIREVQQYLHRNPADSDARQQLMDAYQQKALLYQIALDRIQ